MPPEDQILQGSTKTQERGQLDVVALVVSCSAGTHNCTQAGEPLNMDNAAKKTHTRSSNTSQRGNLTLWHFSSAVPPALTTVGHQRSRLRTQSPGNGVSRALTTTKRPNFVFMSIQVFRLTQKKAIWIGMWNEYLESLIGFSEVMFWQKQCCPL